MVIGNAEYQRIDKLKNTINDAEDISAALRGLGYQVDMKRNLSHLQMVDAVDAFVTKLKGNRLNEGFFWYAGHAVQIQDENYLLPIDVTVDSESRVRAGSYSLNSIIDALESARNKVNILILDSCRDNPLPSSGRGAGSSRGLALISDLPSDLFIMFSTAPGNKAEDGAPGKRNSPFAEAFLKYIKSGEPLSIVAAHITSETMTITGQRQRPFQRGSIVSDAYYSLNPAGPRPAGNTPPAPAPVTPAAVQPSQTYKIGDFGPAGGIVFYDKGVFSNGWRYLEAAPSETEFSLIEWGSHERHIYGTGKAVGTGKRNTQVIIDQHGEFVVEWAAQVCVNLDFNGFKDWFLPSIDELDLMYINLKQKGLGGFANSYWYWSSTQGNTDSSQVIDFGNGKEKLVPKYLGSYVRAIRAF